MSEMVSKTEGQSIQRVVRAFDYLQSEAARLEVLTDPPLEHDSPQDDNPTFSTTVPLSFRSKKPPIAWLLEDRTLPAILVAATVRHADPNPINATETIQKLIDLGIFQSASLNLDEIPRQMVWTMPDGVRAMLTINAISIPDHAAMYAVELENDDLPFIDRCPLYARYDFSPSAYPGGLSLQLPGVRLSEVGWRWLKQIRCEESSEGRTPPSDRDTGAAEASIQPPQPCESARASEKSRKRGKSAETVLHALEDRYGNGKTPIPSYADLAKILDCSSSTIHKAIQRSPSILALYQKQGKIRKSGGRNASTIDRSDLSRELDPWKGAAICEKTGIAMQDATEEDWERLTAMSPEDQAELEQTLRSPVA